MRLSKEKKDKIIEQILATLYSTQRPMFTSEISKEIARDEGFVKSMLIYMKNNNLVVEIKKNPRGKQYLKRSRWILNKTVYEAYKRVSRS